MLIKTQKGRIEINRIGFNLELDAPLLLESLISDETKKCIDEMIEYKLFKLSKEFQRIYEEIENDENKLEYYRENRDIHIYSYACLIRDLGSLSDQFDYFYEENRLIMDVIGDIFQYNRVYGFELTKETKI